MDFLGSRRFWQFDIIDEGANASLRNVIYLYMHLIKDDVIELFSNVQWKSFNTKTLNVKN